MNSEIINAKIEKRILVTDAPIFSGETVKIRLEIDAADAVASNHKIVLFGDDKTALAEGAFSPSESAWIADLNTATREMAAYFEDVPVDATKSIGAMVVNTQTADVITRGNVLVVSTPFPDDLSPCPQTYSYLTTEEFSSSMAAVESEIGGKANASDFIQLSSDVADLSSAMASKAESSTVAALSSAVGDASLIVRRNQYGAVGTGGEVETIIITGDNEEYPMIEFNDEARGGDHYVFMPDGPEGDGGAWHEFYLPNKNGTIALDTDLASKAESSTVAALAAEVAATEKRREVLYTETISEKVNVTSSDLAAKWFYLWSDSPRDACLMRIYFDENNIETGDNSTMRQFYITFAHLPNRVEIRYTNGGPNGYYENIFDLVSEYNSNFQPPSAEGWYTYRFSFCPAYDLYFAELLAYRPL